MTSGYGYDPIEIPPTREYETEDDMMQRKVDDRREANAELIAALRPFVAAYEKHADPIGDSDLYDEQPRSVYVTLGDCRRAARVLWDAGVRA